MRTLLTRVRPAALLALGLGLPGRGTSPRAASADATDAASRYPAQAPAESQHFVLNAEQGEAFWFLGNLFTVKASGTATGGALTVFEAMVRPGNATPRHVHWEEDESFYILEGETRGYCGDEEWRAGPGSFVWLPRGIPHGYRVEGDAPVRQLLIVTPAGFFERFVAEVGEPAQARTFPPPAAPNVEKMRAAAVRHASEILGPPGT